MSKTTRKAAESNGHVWFRPYADRPLERLGERGGFGASELAILLYERIKNLEAEPGA